MVIECGPKNNIVKVSSLSRIGKWEFKDPLNQFFQTFSCLSIRVKFCNEIERTFLMSYRLRTLNTAQNWMTMHYYIKIFI